MIPLFLNTFEIQVPVWDMHKNIAGVNRLKESQPSHLYNWISHNNKQQKNIHRFASTQKTTYYHKKKCQQEHDQHNSKVNEYSYHCYAISLNFTPAEIVSYMMLDFHTTFYVYAFISGNIINVIFAYCVRWYWVGMCCLAKGGKSFSYSWR